MSVAAVASPVPPSQHSYDSDYRANHTHMATESPTTQRRHNKAPRQRQPPGISQHGEIQSDSNLPTLHSQTPRGKKPRQRQNDNRAASGSEGPVPRTVPKSQRTKQIPPGKDNSSILATPAKNLAYASAAFHHSPAASSLPIPKFLSKSVPAPAPESSLQARLEQDPEQSSASPSPPTVSTPDPLAREKSPLDMFFNADRQEKAKKQSVTSLANGNNSPFLPNRSPPDINKDLFTMDIENSDSPSAKRSTRPNPGPRMTSAPGNAPRAGQDDATVAATQSLKDFLKLSQPPSHQQASPQHAMSAASPGNPYRQQNPFVTTPQQQRGDPYNSSLHYGNRNLSPLFQAVRTPNGSTVPANSHDSPLQGKTPIHQSHNFDPRAFIDQQARSNSSGNHPPFSPAQAQRMPNANYNNPQRYDHGYQGVPASPSARMIPNNGVPLNGAPSNQSPDHRRSAEKTPEDSEITDMSAKLRGMLKLGF